MGAPKNKWSEEEEAALKAGIAKHGTGRWSKIIRDPEFNTVLHMRSNVDLKDKWRNIHVAECGLGSRQKSRTAVSNSQPAPNQSDSSLAPNNVVDGIEVIDAKPAAMISDVLPISDSRKPISRLDDHILESITNLKEPRGSSRTAIAVQIKEQYLAPPNLEKLLSTNLKLLTENGKLRKVKHLYRIAQSSPSLDEKHEPSPLLLDEESGVPTVEMADLKLLPKTDAVIALASPSLSVKMDTSMLLLDAKRDTPSLMLHEKKDLSTLVECGNKDPPKVAINGIKNLTKADIDAELKKMMCMSAEEAAAAAEQAVAEADAAILMVEEAAKEAEEAEREAEAARANLEELEKKHLECRKFHSWLRLRGSFHNKSRVENYEY